MFNLQSVFAGRSTLLYLSFAPKYALPPASARALLNRQRRNSGTLQGAALAIGFALYLPGELFDFLGFLVHGSRVQWK
jgi:hypothetical protein